MAEDYEIKRFRQAITTKLANVPFISTYAKTRGRAYVIAWCHRISGTGLVAYVMLHIYTLSSLETPAEFNAKMKLFSFFIFRLLEWLLAIPVIFHALNGARLILYESFGCRDDETMTRWVLGLSAVYVLLMGMLMIMGNQSVTPLFFWLIALIISTSLAYLVASKVWHSGTSIAWKFQRITGAFLLIMVTAHLLFEHINPSVGHEAGVVIDRIQHFFIKVTDLALVIAILYHGGYGLLSIAKDYLQSKVLKSSCAMLIIVIMVIFAWIGLRLTLLV
nr:hypothetical protein [Desulfobacterales bacterium]